MLENIASGRSSSSSGSIQKPRAQGKVKDKDKFSRLAAAAVNRIAKLKAEKGSSKNLPARGPLEKDPNDDEGGPDSGASKLLESRFFQFLVSSVSPVSSDSVLPVLHGLGLPDLP